MLQTLLLTYGGPGRTVVTFEPTYQLHAHIARITGATVVEAERARRLRARPRRGAPRSSATPSRRSRSSARRTTPPALVEAPATVRRRRARRGARPRRRRRGLRPVRAWSALDARRRRPCRSSSCARSPRRGRWRRPGSATSSARRGWSPSSRRSCCRTTSTPPSRSPAGSRCAFVDEMERRVGTIVEERERRRRGAAPSSPSTSCPSGANFVLFRARDHDAGDESGRASRPRRARPRLLVVAAPRRLPAGHRRHAGRERPLPRRPRGGARDDVAPGGDAQPERRKETSIEVALDLDGVGHAPTCSTGHPVLRPHARPARPPRRLRPHRAAPTGDLARRHPPHGRGRRASRSARRSARRSATRPASAASPAACTRSTRRWSRSPSTCRAGRSWRRTSSCREVAAARQPAVRPAARRARRGVVRHDAGITLHVTLAGRPQRPPHHRGHVQGPRPLPARRRAGRGRRRSRRTKGVL